MFLLERIWTLGLWVRKAVECFKCCLKDQASRNIEDNGAEHDLNSGELAQEVSEEKRCLCCLEIALMIFWGRM